MENSNGDKVVLDIATGGTKETAGDSFCASETSERLAGRERETETSGGGYVGLGERMEQSLLWRKPKQFGLDGACCCCSSRSLIPLTNCAPW